MNPIILPQNNDAINRKIKNLSSIYLLVLVLLLFFHTYVLIFRIILFYFIFLFFACKNSSTVKKMRMSLF
jgi:hypothetical protein